MKKIEESRCADVSFRRSSISAEILQESEAILQAPRKDVAARRLPISISVLKAEAV